VDSGERGHLAAEVVRGDRPAQEDILAILTALGQTLTGTTPRSALAGAGDRAVATLGVLPGRLGPSFKPTAAREKGTAGRATGCIRALPGRSTKCALAQLGRTAEHVGRAVTTCDALAERGQHLLERIRHHQATPELPRHGTTTRQRAWARTATVPVSRSYLRPQPHPAPRGAVRRPPAA
jgi:hypothetical protein